MNLFYIPVLICAEIPIATFLLLHAGMLLSLYSIFWKHKKFIDGKFYLVYRL